MALLRCSYGHWQDWQKLLIYTYLSEPEPEPEPDSDSDSDSCHLQPTTVIISSSSSFSLTPCLCSSPPSSTHAITLPPPPLFSAFLLRNKLFHRAKKSRTSLNLRPLALSALSSQLFHYLQVPYLVSPPLSLARGTFSPLTSRKSWYPARYFTLLYFALPCIALLYLLHFLHSTSPHIISTLHFTLSSSPLAT